MATRPNGHEETSRIDRIERAIEGLIDGQERLVSAQHQLLTSEKQMLTAQSALTDAVTALAKRVDSAHSLLTEAITVLAEKAHEHEDRIETLVESQLQVQETLAYIKKLLGRLSGEKPDKT